VLEAVFEKARKPFEERIWGARLAGIVVTGFHGNHRYLVKLHRVGARSDEGFVVFVHWDEVAQHGEPTRRPPAAAPMGPMIFELTTC
jgi:hypothetical protein